MRNTDKIIKLVTAVLMAAMTCIVTISLPIKLPYGAAYVHLGNTFVLLSGIILGPVYGSLAAGIGSMSADFILNAPQYALGTLVIKFLAAMLGAYSYRHIKRSVILSGILGSIVVTLGYFIYESFLYHSFLVAFGGILGNIVQNIMGIILALLIIPILKKVPQIREMINEE